MREHASGVPAAPYGRALGVDEFTRLSGRFDALWGRWSGGGVDRTDTAPTLTLWSHWFEGECHLAALRTAVAARGHLRVWELREWGDSFEIDVAAADFEYNGAEGFWSAGAMDWMVYASHEASITFGGEWLIEAVKRVCPDWAAGLYDGWDKESPRRGT